MRTRDIKDENNYKSYLKVFKKVSLAAKTTFYKEKFDTRMNNTKQLWTNLNKIGSLGKTKSNTNIIEIIYNSEKFAKPQDICDKLNEYFCSVGANLIHSLKPCDQRDFEKYCPHPSKDSMFCSPVLPDEVAKIIQKFPNSKAPGQDNIGAKILKEISNQLVMPLAYLFNLSFTTGEVPEQLKIAKVIPVYKKGERNLPENYRPISLLSIFDKIMEKLMYARLSNFLENNKVLYKYQFGFRKNHSTSQAVMELIDDIYQHRDNHQVSMGIYLDLKKAFDTVNHSILLKKLEIYGIRGIILKWFTSYLSNRTQYTVLNKYQSKQECINYGVPQGSVLGPLLFLVYVNDIQFAISGSEIVVKLFADDTNLFLHSTDLAELFDRANVNMTRLYNWFIANRLSLNLDKTCYSLFGCRNEDLAVFNLYVSGKAIRNVECCKYLGIFIDSELKWQEHIDFIHNKLVKFTSIFYKIRIKLPYEILKMIYFAFVHSHIFYGIEVYGNTTANRLSKLKVLNNKLLRILQYKPFRTHVSELYRTYHTLPIDLLHDYQIMLFMHCYVYNRSKLPVVFHKYFEENESVHNHNTRQKHDFHTHIVHSETGKKSIKYKGSKLWNALPIDMKNISSKYLFKKKAKDYLLQFME